MSKTSKPRPFSIPRTEYEANHDAIDWNAREREQTPTTQGTAMNENEQQAPVLHNPVTVERQSALIALRALSQLWSDHVGGLDMEVRVAIEDLERVTGIRLNLVERR